MKKRNSRTIARRLTKAKVAITNALADPEILTKVSDFSYDTARLNAGKVLYDVAVAKTRAIPVKAGEEKAAAEEVKKKRTVLQKAYQELAKVGRTVFAEDSGARNIMGLNRAMPIPESEFLPACRDLFNTGAYTASMKAALSDHRYTDAKLAAEKAKISQLVQVINTLDACRGASEQALQEQTAALRSLDKWMGAFTRIGRVALSDKKHLLAKMGLLVRSAQTQAQRRSPAKAVPTRRKQQLLKLAA
jgi:hypothetical protein